MSIQESKDQPPKPIFFLKKREKKNLCTYLFHQTPQSQPYPRAQKASLEQLYCGPLSQKRRRSNRGRFVAPFWAFGGLLLICCRGCRGLVAFFLALECV